MTENNLTIDKIKEMLRKGHTVEALNEKIW